MLTKLINYIREPLNWLPEPSQIIGPVDSPYLYRWWVIPRNSYFNIYLHRFHRSDDDRALHDHPWINVSLVLSGRYYEILFQDNIQSKGMTTSSVRIPGRLYFRSARTAHRIVLTRDGLKRKENPVWTLFFTGPWERTWGFHCPKKWIPWREFTEEIDGASVVGKGCGEYED